MDLICFSHLRWNFVYQRPQRLLNRFTKKFRVFYIEEPEWSVDASDEWRVSNVSDNLFIVVPYLKYADSEEDVIALQRKLLSKLLADYNVTESIFWYYTPMALEISNHITPNLVVYDCMDELSAFKFAPPKLKLLERDLLSKAGVVFTGGYSLYNAKKHLHPNIHPFPSSIEKEHFALARNGIQDPVDQAPIPGKRFGFYGVIDERFNLELIGEVASKKPDWQFVIIGPVVKIDPAILPRNANIHYLGGKSYNELPQYLAGWDVAIIPFVLDDSTKYISPTKTPEYLAAGKPVISTSITDVVTPYGIKKLVHIADTADEFIKAGEYELTNVGDSQWLSNVDHMLATVSWDRTWEEMVNLIEQELTRNKNLLTNLNEEVYV